jgi:ankyrin repeat protein
MCDFQGLNALAWAVLGNKHKAVDLLIKQGLDIESTDLQMRTPLHHASSISDSRLFLL